MSTLLSGTTLVAASKTKGGWLPAGGSHGDGVGAQANGAAQRWEHCWANAGHANANHVVLQGHHGVIHGHAQVTGVAHGDHAYAHVPGLFDGQLHCDGCDDDSQGPVGINGGGARGLPDDAPVGIGVHYAVLVPLYVPFQHVGNAVALDAHEVGLHQHVSACGRVVGGHADVLENALHRGAQVVGVNPDAKVLG